MLKRTRVGVFCLEDTISLEKLQTIRHNAAPFEGVRSIDAVLDDILVLQINLLEAKAIQQGKRIQTDVPLKDGTLALYSQEKLIAIAEHQQGEVRPVRVFNH
jgi:tRNA U55 pseudouridine synthase TruB